MQPVDEALYAVLSADTELIVGDPDAIPDPIPPLAPGGVWRQLAPLETPVPFVVFRKSLPDEDKYTMTGLAYRWLTIEVAGVDRSESGKAAQAALARVELLLQDADAVLSAEMTGWTVASVRRQSNVEDHFIDLGGQVWQTAASTFRMMVVPA